MIVWLTSTAGFYMTIWTYKIFFVIYYAVISVFCLTVVQRICPYKSILFTVLKFLSAIPMGILFTSLTLDMEVIGNAGMGWDLIGKPSEQEMLQAEITLVICIVGYFLLIINKGYFRTKNDKRENTYNEKDES